MSYQKIQARLARGETILLDGGVGTEILRRGVYWRCHGIERNPDVVREVHADYIRAGADVIKTNTFQLNRRAYSSLFHGLEHLRRIGPPGLEHKAGKLLAQAIELVREARRQAGKEDDGVAIAGVISPIEHSFRPDLVPPSDQCRAEHAEVVGQMKEGGLGRSCQRQSKLDTGNNQK
ncbi:MAG: homocysteine S-methyltransferase family protein [Acidobacteria bacterium]|nr:homocysteine S-methyltransferase family protein [Acidobacteriota bacterium]